MGVISLPVEPPKIPAPSRLPAHLALVEVCGLFGWLGSAGGLIEAPRRGIGAIEDRYVDAVVPSCSWVAIDWFQRNGGREILWVDDLRAIAAGPAWGVTP